jgi:AraC family transcriptional regulator
VAVSDGLALSPTGTELSYDAAGELACLVGILPRAAVKTLVSASTGRSWDGDFGRLHATMFEDAAVEVLLRRLWDEAKENSPHGALFADSAWTTLLLALLAAAGERFQPVPVRGGLAGWQERRATEYLRSHMAEDVTLDALAGVAALSTFHFARQFKQSTGLPPHAYLRRLRCERAKELLLGTNLPVTEIAAQVGYETPQAFARMFRAGVGASPSDYRRERRS